MSRLQPHGLCCADSRCAQFDGLEWCRVCKAWTESYATDTAECVDCYRPKYAPAGTSLYPFARAYR